MGSFRDPSGFIYKKDNIIFRQINPRYAPDFQLLQQSGLLEKLWEQGVLIPHTEEPLDAAYSGEAFKIIKPEPIAFISYPYEWSFSQLKDAALLTLNIQAQALDCGLVLKDASAYNIQFHKGKPVFIDTLSFETYRENKPWIAYGQFCSHFLAPLALMSFRDIRLNQLLKSYIDGIPLDLAAGLLPFKAKTNVGILAHLHLHAKSQKRFSTIPIEKNGKERRGGKISLTGLKGIVESLKATVKSLTWAPKNTQWAEYYTFTNYTSRAFLHKEEIVAKLIAEEKPATVWDIGANDGKFSRIAALYCERVISFDNDPAAIEKNYIQSKSIEASKILPVLMDWTNPSPGIGWSNEERMSLLERGPADVAIALAFVHHLAIGNNVPLGMIAQFFAGLCTTLIIEWVPKDDSQVMRLLQNREDIFIEYTEADFVAAFGEYFSIVSRIPVDESRRILFKMHTLNPRPR